MTVKELHNELTKLLLDNYEDYQIAYPIEPDGDGLFEVEDFKISHEDKSIILII